MKDIAPLSFTEEGNENRIAQRPKGEIEYKNIKIIIL